MTQSGVPCALSRSVPALFWLSRNLVLRHLYVSDHLDCTVIYPRVLRAHSRLVFDTLGDPQFSRSVFVETTYLFLKSFTFHI